MEFSFPIRDVLPIDHEGFTILNAANMKSTSRVAETPAYYNPYTKTKADPVKQGLTEILDRMGNASSKAQGLKQVITNHIKFTTSGDNRLYMRAEENRVYGILKVGKKNLFYRDSRGTVKELQPLCVLDFYVHESVQRSGLGKQIFEKMLEKENIDPSKIAYDRPSPKLIAFLKKHYGLASYVPQNNNFVIFNAFWDSSNKTYQGNRSTVHSSLGHGHHNEERKEYLNSDRGHSRGTSQREFEKNYHSTSRNGNSSYTPKNEEKVIVKEEVRGRGPTQPIKDDFAYSSMNDNIKTTESLIKQTEQKIHQLNLEKQKLMAPDERRQKEFHNTNPPWANHADHFNNYKTSNCYGNYYNRFQPERRHGK